MINLYIVDYHNPSRDNGLNTYVSQLGKGLNKFQNFRVHYIWINYKGGLKGFNKIAEKDVIHYYIPGNIAIAGDRSGYDLKVADYLADEMCRRKNIIVHFNWINHCPFAYLLKKKVNCKAILSKHCIPWRDLITTNYPVFSRVNRWLSSQRLELSFSHPVLLREQLSYRAMDQVICVSQSGKRSLEKVLRYPLEQISVIYNGFETSELRLNSRKNAVLRREYHINPDEKIILFAGSIVDRKGAYDLAHTFESLILEHPDKIWRLVFAGNGDFKKLLKTINKAWAKITLTGNLSKERLYDFYVMADIGVIPSYVEQFGYSALEMMAMGLPVIAADVDGLREVVPDDCGLKVKLVLGDEEARIDVAELKNKLHHLLENEDEALAYGCRAKAHVIKQFPAEKMAEQTVAVYKKVLAENHTSGSDAIIYPKENQPLVSILLPCFNDESHITECMESILKQSWQNWELIVVDSGSTDRTLSLIEKFKDDRIRYVKDEVN